jgi:predicted negative regulator of RcsB-dependent stress response
VNDLAPPKIKTAKQAVQPLQADPGLPAQIHDWLEQNRNKIGGFFAGLFVVFLIALGVQSYWRGQESRAQERYAQMMQQWPKDLGTADNQALEKLVPDLQRFIQEHDGRQAARLARLDLARVLYQLQRMEDALALNQNVLDGTSDPVLRSMARYQAALTLQGLGRADQAIAYWNGLKGEPSLVSERELDWHLASLYGGRKEYVKAIEHLELSIQASGDYPTSQLLEDQLASLKAAAAQGS